MSKPTVLVIGKPDPKHKECLLTALRAEADVIVADEASVSRPVAPRAEVVLLWDEMRSLLMQLWPALERIRWLHVRTAGLDHLWFSELIKSPVTLTNAKGIYSPALAEFTLGAMLFFAKNFRRMLINQAERRWEWMDLAELRGHTVGLLGYGSIGQTVARKAKAMDMRVLAAKRRPRPDDRGPEVDQWFPVERREEMMASSDYVVLALPLTPETRGLVDERALRAMQATAYLINVGRGAVVREAALVRALEEGWIAGAALDVFEREPLPPESPFYRLPNVLISPHSADHTPGWVEAGLELFLENFRYYRQGQPLKNVVDKQAGY